MASSFLARAALFISLALATAQNATAWQHGSLLSRALADNTQKTLFTPANSTGIYIIIDVNDQEVPVQIDLASGDLYIAGTLAGAGSLSATSVEALAHYDFTTPPVSGSFPIKLSVPVSIGGQKISQSLILDDSTDKAFIKQFPDNTAAGVLGFGSSPLSAVVNGLKQGKSPMTEVYSQNLDAPFSTILYAGLDESQPTDLQFTGLFTANEVIDLDKFFPGAGAGASSPDLKQITQQPAISLGGDVTFDVSKLTINGADLKTTGKGTVNTTSLFSVGTSDVVKAMYSNIPGARLDDGSGIYTVPCNAEVTATITIPPMAAPIPLDPATLVIRSPWSSSECVGSFRANKAAATPTDLSLGLSFLQNVYFLIGYSDSSLVYPIMKLLPLIDAAAAHQYFTSTRTSATWSSTGSSSPSYPAGSPSTQDKPVGLLGDAVDDNSDSSSIPHELKYWLPAIIVGAAVLGLVAIGAGIFALVWRRRSGTSRESAYRNIHHVENMESSKDLYGHDEESASKYSDPYHDRI